MRFFKLFLSLMLATGILLGCGSADSDQSDGQTEVQNLQVEIVVSQENGAEILAQEELEIEEGLTLMEVMKENFEVEEEEGFISAINGLQAEEGESYAWLYTINGEQATVGAADYEIENGDVIEFDFQSWE